MATGVAGDDAAETARDAAESDAVASAESGAAPSGLAAYLRRLLGESGATRRSLFGEILDWLLVPLMLLWPISIILTYVSAKSLSDPPFDRALAESTQALAEQLKLRNGRLTADVPLPARAILRADDVDTVYFQVLGARGEFLAGDRELPSPEEDEGAAPGQVQFRNDVLHGYEVRIAYLYALPEGAPRDARVVKSELPLVQVAETLNKRAQLANEIVKGVILPQFIVLPLAVTLVWFGLVRGLVPLAQLSERIQQRKPGDLSPIEPGAVPEEVAPLIGSFNQLMRRLDASLKGQQRFIANAAHQLRTPLAGLRTQTELALRQFESEGDREELHRSLRQIVLSTERAVRMVNQLLSLSRAERAGEAAAPPQLRVVELDRLVRERVLDWVDAALKKRIDLGCDEARAVPVVIEGDPVLLGELAGNLIDNAIRYTPPGGTINVHVRAAPADAPMVGGVLEVEDSGPGIPPAERELVFERFYRVLGSDPEGRNVEGSGLGLAIVREIVARHHAHIAIGESSLGGARFTVTFPRPGPGADT